MATSGSTNEWVKKIQSPSADVAKQKRADAFEEAYSSEKNPDIKSELIAGFKSDSDYASLVVLLRGWLMKIVEGTTTPAPGSTTPPPPSGDATTTTSSKVVGQLANNTTYLAEELENGTVKVTLRKNNAMKVISRADFDTKLSDNVAQLKKESSPMARFARSGSASVS